MKTIVRRYPNTSLAVLVIWRFQVSVTFVRGSFASFHLRANRNG